MTLTKSWSFWVKIAKCPQFWKINLKNLIEKKCCVKVSWKKIYSGQHQAVFLTESKKHHNKKNSSLEMKTIYSKSAATIDTMTSISLAL